MPTIFQICVEGNTGSTGRIAESLGIFAIQQGWESYIAYGRFPRPSKSNLIQIGSKWDVFLHGLQTRFLDRHCLGSKQATIKLVKQIKVIKPDVIHLHHLHGYYLNIKILFAFLSKTSIPVIWTFHDCWSITGHCAHFDFVGCDKWKLECTCCPQKKEYPASLFIDRSKKNYNLKKALFNSVENMTVVTVSNWLNNIVERSFMGNIGRQIIYNGIDINIFTADTNHNKIRQQLNIGEKFMILGVASPWGKRKGLNDFIKLSELLDVDMIIILVGLNESQIKHLPKNIIGLKRTENQQQLKDLYATADLFINFSVEEVFGLTTAEALSCGTPAVVYNSTACPEIIDTNTGFVVNKGDIKGVINSIDLIRKNGKSFYKLACRERALKLFNKEDSLTGYFNLYQKVITH